MKKAIDPEVQSFRHAMGQWQHSDALATKVNQAHARFGSSVVTANEFKFWREASNAAGNAFSEVWVLWKRTAYQAWRDGYPGDKIHRRTERADLQGLS